MPRVLAAAVLALTVGVLGLTGTADAAPGAAGTTAVPEQDEPFAPADDGTGDSSDRSTDRSTDGGEADAGDAPAGGEGIIPDPNSGSSPDDAGDRGGALQIVVFLALAGGVAAIGALATRDIRRGRRARADAQPSGPYSSQAS